MEGQRNFQGLQRLVGRHPSLQHDPTVNSLLSKGHELKNEDILSVSQKLLLRPEFTVAVAGCFRHILPQIVTHMVNILQERHSKHLSAPSHGVIEKDLLTTNCCNLCIHEYATVAFSRLLELSPVLLSSILQYFSFAPAPFERLVQGNESAHQAQLELLDVVRASYRFIQMEPSSFEKLWDWSPFLELLLYKECDGSPMQNQYSIDIRWCAVQVVSLIFKLSDEVTHAVGSTISCLSEEMTFTCLLRWEEFCQEISVEKSGWFLEPGDSFQPSETDRSITFGISLDQSHVKWIREASNQISHVEICGVQFPVRKSNICKESWSLSFGKSFVLTSTLKNGLKGLVLALSRKEPVLLEGPAGCGKTSAIREVAQLTGNSDVVYIHLDEQLDIKTLLGTYICTEIPGEFKWQPGALTQAVLRGLWVVFENIDRAPSDILSALVPLLESRRLYIPGHSETVRAAEGFQLIATVTRTDAVNPSHSPGSDLLNNLWRRVAISAPKDYELRDIIELLFPSLKPFVSQIIATFKLINGCFSESLNVDNHLAKKNVYGRQFSTRDILKWCQRLKSFNTPAGLSIHEAIFREAVDCFAAFIPDCKSRIAVMNKIGKMWGVSQEQVHFLETLNKPVLQVCPDAVQIGRAGLPIYGCKETKHTSRPFANTGNAMRNLERLAVCVQHQEPVLLVGETGTGKTTLVQHLAEHISIPLTVMNLSQQSDSADFIGGFKPIEAQQTCKFLLERFESLFRRTFPLRENAKFLATIKEFSQKRKFSHLLKAFDAAVKKVEGPSGSLGGTETTTAELQPETKRKRSLSKDLRDDWDKFCLELKKCKRQVAAAENSFAFSFVEGAFVKALRYGHWILLDELNLAPVETLERLTGVLEGEQGSLSLTERGDIEVVPRHPNFRVFACMNPATDIGKQDLPLALRNRFTELYIDELTAKEDLNTFVFQYLDGYMPCPPVEAIVEFYQRALQEAETRLFDSANQKPRYSLRTLARALEYTQIAMPIYGFARALYDGIWMTFLTLLDKPSSIIMENLIFSHLFKKLGFDSKHKTLLAKVPGQPSPNYILFEHFWLEKGDYSPSESSLEALQQYVLTPTIRENLKNVAKAVFVHKYPVLLQGPTSSGKTSLIEYLATMTCHRFVRINNHEHTDLQEYLGSYVTSPSGGLVFQEGILVEAVRNGYWVVLDELNLAPSEVLEALNRLLDDNRELFVPELQIVVRPHPHFMLFATQNPPGVYGGRKVLSRAFRNRFLELHVDDIPEDELCNILEKRCEIPKSHAEKMVSVMKDLQRTRQTSHAFAGKHGFITPRDLFRWADRHRRAGVSYDDLAKFGYVLLAERLRDESERQIVLEALEKNLRVKINVETIYTELPTSSNIKELEDFLRSESTAATFGKIVWTKSMRRLFSLVEHCYEHNEPILLIGETGCGKTTVCQLLAMVHQQKLHILNCHQYTETSDFLGGYRPVRDRDAIISQYELSVNNVHMSKLFQEHIPFKLSQSLEDAKMTLPAIENVIKKIKTASVNEHDDELTNSLRSLELNYNVLKGLYMEWQSLFIWKDGPLVEAMKKGDLLLIDEISLADDSVLERLNSVLEPKRLLVLAEKGGSNLEEIIGHPNFLILATMNPGGDFGKKELSPALRNRFTEIWVPAISGDEDLRSIIVARFSKPDTQVLTEPLLKFWKWFQAQNSGRLLTVRDLLSWIHFVNTVHYIGIYRAFIHGAFLVLLDGIGLGMGLSLESAKELKSRCLEFLLQLVPMSEQLRKTDFEIVSSQDVRVLDTMVGINPFFIAKGTTKPKNISYELMAPTTSRNVFRILRAMQLSKPVLIEGSPGVGKTSLIAATANLAGHTLVRINLSEQTDMVDLLGSYLPVEGPHGADFSWSDGVFLQALKSGSWVLLDELNLASQSVLEGLNACLDHRGEVFIPELGRTFKCHPNFRIFACQNPSVQGGGRKNLPRSFLNRFTKVYVDALSEEDYIYITSSLYPAIEISFLQKLIQFNDKIFKDTMVLQSYGRSGAPWEFNLRDILRSCALLEENKCWQNCFLEVVYLQRMRTAKDRCIVLKVYEEVFRAPAIIAAYPKICIDSNWLKIGDAILKRSSGPQPEGHNDDLTFLPTQVKCLEALMVCIQKGWMSILIGGPACGKTSMVRFLAKLTGNTLQEFSLSSSTDASDLLGCFEQNDLIRSWQKLVKDVHYLVQVVSGLCLSSCDNDLPTQTRISAAKKVIVNWHIFEKCLDVRIKGFSGCANQLQFLDASAMEMLCTVLEQIKYIDHILKNSLKLQIEKLETEASEIRRKFNSRVNSRHFEWVDGAFLRAVERGDWVLLENANLCNPTVLDRLNPLLEPDGAILVNERGLIDGHAMMLRAHPNFRLFLTVDPSHGEVSRAMRNRGVEIFVMQPHSWIPDSAIVCSKFQLNKDADDAKQYLVHMGIPSSYLCISMCNIHVEMKSLIETSLTGRVISLRDLYQWVGLFKDFLYKGSTLLESMFCSWEQIYAHGIQDAKLRSELYERCNTFISEMGVKHLLKSSITLQVPCGWPLPRGLEQVCKMSKEMVTVRDCSYIYQLLAEQFSEQYKAVYHHKRGDKNKGLREDVQNQIKYAVMFPVRLLQFLLHPSESIVVDTEENLLEVQDLDKMVCFAGLWMMEQVSDRSSLGLRLVWLKASVDKFAQYCKSLVLLYKVLQKELEHTRFAKLYETDRETVQKKIDALRRTLMKWQVEDDTLMEGQRDVHIRFESLVMQSFRNSVTHSRTLCVHPKFIDVLYPLLCSIRRMEEDVLVNHIWSAQTYFSYIRFLDSHVAFWETIHNCKCNSWTTAFLACWKKLKKSAHSLIATIEYNGNKQEVFSESINIFEVADHVINDQFGTVKLYLWKHSGHPVIPSSKEAFQNMRTLLKFCHNTSCGNHVIRQRMLEGVGISLWLLQGEYKSYAQNIDSNTAILETDNIIKTLVLRHEEDELHRSSGKVKFPAVDNCRCYLPHLLQESGYYELLSSNSTGLNSSGPILWLDCVCLNWDHGIISAVTDVASRLNHKIKSNVSEAELLEVKKYLISFIDFSVKFASRHPLELVPHQQLLWLISGCKDEMQKRSFISEFKNIVHQIRYNWHQSLWCKKTRTHLGASSEILNGISGPSLVFCATESQILSSLMLEQASLRDYKAKIMEFRLMGSVLWKRGLINRAAEKSDLILASAALSQIIYCYSTTFVKEDLLQLNLLLQGLHPSQPQGYNRYSEKDIQGVANLLNKSTDKTLTSVVDTHIKPCLHLMYSEWSTEMQFTDRLFLMGKIWLYLGDIRLKLILPRQAFDPAEKYAYYCKTLYKSISDAKLELQVRQDSDCIIRGGSQAGKYSELKSRIDELQDEAALMSAKGIYRPEPGKLISFYNEIERFVKPLEESNNVLKWITLLDNKTFKPCIDLTTSEILQWQEVAMQFINQLSTEYQDYHDLAQPLQLSVFELKMGLSLLESGFLVRHVMGQADMNIHEILKALMQFPVTTLRSMSTAESAMDILDERFDCVVKRMKATKTSERKDERTWPTHLRVKVLYCALINARKSLVQSGFVYGDSLKIVKKLLQLVSTFWEERRNYKSAQDKEQSFIQFKCHSHSMDGDDGEEGFQTLFPDYLESQDLLDNEAISENLDTEKAVLNTSISCFSDQQWRKFEDKLSTEVSCLQNRIFGALGAPKGTVDLGFVSEEEILQSFSLSYDVGKTILEDACPYFSASITRQLLPTHMMMLSLRHSNMISTSVGKKSFNIYMDASPSELACLLNPLEALQGKIRLLLDEWPEQPTLLQILRGIDALMRMPTDVPLMKALIGVQQLLSKTQLWDENAPKDLSLTDVLGGLSILVTKWRKLELEYWEALLNKVEAEFDLQADKLWFPLYGVLHPDSAFDNDSDLVPTIESLEEFMQSATMGEYKRRLEILMGFYGEFDIQRYSSNISSHGPSLVANVLYNICGYYSQFLPLVEETITAGRSTIKRELEDFIKLHKWDNRSYYTLSSSTESTHRKVYKLVRKYKDHLNKPAVLVLLEKKKSNSESMVQSLNHHLGNADDASYRKICSCDVLQGCLEKKIQGLVTLSSEISVPLDQRDESGIQSIMLPSVLPKFWRLLSSNVFDQTVTAIREKGALWLEDLATSVISRSAELQEGEKKSMVKKKSLVDLLRALRNLGLSPHRAAIPKEYRTNKSWIQQPASRVDGLLALLIENEKGCVEVQNSELESTSRLWEKSQDYYFKNLSLVQEMRQTSLNYHKDLSLKEVSTSTAYMEHILYLQQKQRLFAQGFILKLVKLQHLKIQLTGFDSEGSPCLILKQDLTRRWMWTQKGLVDAICSSCNETSILYLKMESVQNCPSRNGISEFLNIKTKLEDVASKMNCCKRKLDKVLLSGVHLFCENDMESTWPVIVTPVMANTVAEIFTLISDSKTVIETLWSEDRCHAFGLSSLRELFQKAQVFHEDFQKQFWGVKTNESSEAEEPYVSKRSQFISEVLISVQSLERLKNFHEGGSNDNNSIQNSSIFMEQQMSALRLDKLYNSAVEVMRFNDQGNDTPFSSVKDSHVIFGLLEIIISVGMMIFSDYISLLKSVSKLTYILCKTFSNLYQNGFCKKEQDSEGDDCSKIEEASGTGLGEGEGKTDVSNEIEDEEQLLGCSDKGTDDQNKSERGEDNSKGIEMGEDFEGDMVDISPSETDNESDSEDGEEDQLESKMGETGENENTIDEKLWGSDDTDELQQEERDKYETGQSVECGVDELEMRAQQDGDSQPEHDNNAQDLENKPKDSEDLSPEDNNDTRDDSPFDKKDAYEPPSGVDPSAEPDNDCENIEDNVENNNDTSDPMNIDGDENGAIEISDDEGRVGEELSDDIEMETEEGGPSDKETQQALEDEDHETEAAPGGNMQIQPNSVSEVGGLEGLNANDMTSDPVDSKMNQSSAMDVTMEHSSQMQCTDMSTSEQMGGIEYNQSSVNRNHDFEQKSTFARPQPESVISEPELDHDMQHDRLDANPFRSLGDALKEWKDRVAVSDQDVAEDDDNVPLQEETANQGLEYQYVTNNQNSTEQALGSAKPEQLENMRDQEIKKEKEDTHTANENQPRNEKDCQDREAMEVAKKTLPNISRKSTNAKMESRQDDSDHNLDTETELTDMTQDDEESVPNDDNNVCTRMEADNHDDNLDAVPLSDAKTYTVEDVYKIRMELETKFKDDSHYEKAKSMWLMYESLTGRLSQELTEQLRLIMEPTLASRLEGDYRTGKRINLKKIIPYIASQFRKDKIWMRRTKPSKRQYQVVLAIDDSRSMSENHCGHLALEALITICRSMSTLEVGQMAVASFGQKGNIKLLHDFDTPFSSEVGIQMISQFSFKQDNTIADEPMVDLLNYLTTMLEVVSHNSSSSGRQLLRQLVLVLADGRFHEKETLRRCIREAVSRGQMLAFIVLDNSRESIMDVQSVSFSGGAPKFSKYIDSFPFPYYIILKNIEELPRTLANLLRQWFELVQRTTY